MSRYVLVLGLILVLSVGSCSAQKTFAVMPQQFAFCPQHVDALYCFIPLFGLRNFNNETGAELSFQTEGGLRINTLLGIETSTLPLPSPAAGVAFVFNPKMGTFVASRESFGPILSDRAETLGNHLLHVAFTYQHFGFESLDGLPLNQLLQPKDPFGLLESMTLRVDQFTAFLTYGVTSRIDVSAAFPVRTVHITANGAAFGGSAVPVPDSEAAGSSGISDITLRAKANLWKRESGGLSIAADVRTPTGEPLKFLGSGAIGVKPLLIGSWGKTFHHLYIGPHVNVGYQWNGTSILGGALLGEEGRLPRVFSYAAGTELGVHKRATFTLDFTGQHLFSADRSYVFSPGTSSVAITTNSITLDDASIGAKVNPFGTLLLTGNLGVRLDNGGLRARLIPLVGVSYTF